jgi:hypothetical protein
MKDMHRKGKKTKELLDEKNQINIKLILWINVDLFKKK